MKTATWLLLVSLTGCSLFTSEEVDEFPPVAWGLVHGHVRWVDDEPAAGVHVGMSCDPEGTYSETETDDQGWYEVGAYIITVPRDVGPDSLITCHVVASANAETNSGATVEVPYSREEGAAAAVVVDLTLSR